MVKTKRYELDGIVLDIPVYYDEQAKIYIEDYPDFIENPIRTKNGYRVLFSGTDACELSDRRTVDCGSCRYFERAGEHTWLGICKNEENKNHIGGKEK